MVEGAGVDHNVHIPLDIRGIGADHRGGITAGEGAEGGVFRREFQINVSGDAGGVHGTEDRASACGGIRETEEDVPVERAGSSVSSVPGGGLSLLGDGQPDVSRVVAAVRINMSGVSGGNGDVYGIPRSPCGGIRLGAGIKGTGAGQIISGFGESLRFPLNIAFRCSTLGEGAGRNKRLFRVKRSGSGRGIGTRAVQGQVVQNSGSAAVVLNGEAVAAGAGGNGKRFPNQHVPQPDVIAAFQPFQLIAADICHTQVFRIGGHVQGIQNGIAPFDVGLINIERAVKGAVPQADAEIGGSIPSVCCAVSQNQVAIKGKAVLQIRPFRPGIGNGAFPGLPQADAVLVHSDIGEGKPFIFQLAVRAPCGGLPALVKIDGQAASCFSFLSGGAPRVAHGPGDIAGHKQISLGIGMEAVAAGVVEHGAYAVERRGGCYVNDAGIDVNDRDVLPAIPPCFQTIIVISHGLVGGVRIAVGVPGPAGNGKDDDIRMFIGLEHGLHDGVHIVQEVLGNGVKAVRQRGIVSVGKEIVGADHHEKGIRRIVSGECLA